MNKINSTPNVEVDKVKSHAVSSNETANAQYKYPGSSNMHSE